jgi:hypothetical protein
VTGAEFKQIREDIGKAIGRNLSNADMARLCNLPAQGGSETVVKWQVTGPPDSSAELLRILAMSSDRHPILEKFDVFDRFDIPEKDRPARRQQFREKMQDEVRQRLS